MSAVLEISRTEDPLTAALSAYLDAKRAEDAAKKRRVEAEERILALQPAKAEGATTVEVGGYKVTLTGAMSYKLDDIETLRHITARWDSEMVPLKTKTELDPTGCKWLRSNRPDLWAEVAKCITVSPAKTSVKVSV